MNIKNPYPGFYRALVVDNKDPEKMGRILVWIPDLMVEKFVPKTSGIWARPANTQVGGRNMEEDSEHHYMGQSFIPKKGSWVFVFFESNNPNRPYYFGALDIENTTVLPENKLGSNYEDKWTIFKSHDGRCVIVSDDPDDERVEITGKKRQITEPPTGDKSSVYQIDGNQTTILLDERAGKEKVLIRTHRGDFFHIDVDERKLQAYFKDEIHIKSDSKIFIKAADDIHIKTDKKLYTYSEDETHIKTNNKMYVESEDDMHHKTNKNMYRKASSNIEEKSLKDIKIEAVGKISHKDMKGSFTDSGENVNILGAQNVNIDGLSQLIEQGGAAQQGETTIDANSAVTATPADPKGERDT
jgi:hypothetical protein